MRRPQGYATITDPDAALVELDTFSCGHCGGIKHVRPREDPASLGGLCKCCMRLICERCVGSGCDVIEHKLERWEARANARRWIAECA